MSVGHSYAKALFDAVQESQAASRGSVPEVESNFQEIVGTVEASLDLKRAFESPLTSLQEKVALTEALSDKMGFTQMFKSFLGLLAKKDRLALLENIYSEWNSVRLEAEGAVAGLLLCANPIENTDVETLVKAFSKKLGKKVTFRVETDPSLLAGMKVTVNGVTYDGSLRSQLQKLHEHFVVGAPGAHA